MQITSGKCLFSPLNAELNSRRRRGRDVHTVRSYQFSGEARLHAIFALGLRRNIELALWIRYQEKATEVPVEPAGVGTVFYCGVIEPTERRRKWSQIVDGAGNSRGTSHDATVECLSARVVLFYQPRAVKSPVSRFTSPPNTRVGFNGRATHLTIRRERMEICYCAVHGSKGAIQKRVGRRVSRTFSIKRSTKLTYGSSQLPRKSVFAEK